VEAQEKMMAVLSQRNFADLAKAEKQLLLTINPMPTATP
jgi:hypothetical protein